MNAVSVQSALVYVMTVAAFADGRLDPSETRILHHIVGTMPVFEGFSEQQFQAAMSHCTEMLDHEEGIETIVGLAREALPARLHETAYALVCDVIASDGRIEFEELEWLGMVRRGLKLNELVAAAIEYATRARFRKHRAPGVEGLSV